MTPIFDGREYYGWSGAYKMGFTVCANWKDSKKCKRCENILGIMPCWEPKILETQEDVDRFYRGY